MLSISHAATGAFIAAKVQNPLLYVPLVLVSHYIEDYILHWDVGTGLSNGTRQRAHAFLLEFIDLGLAIFIIWLMYKSATPAVQFNASVGGFVGLVPDFMEAPRNFLHWNPWFLKPFNHFHHMLHHSTPNMVLGLVPQIILIALLFAFK
ncbi:MAG TPA: hypothetical protein VFG51_00050 [Candidatus Saccharimonadia bacterium]|nr:hypothetical protein [Candidatus Saccharimonadia bacterium]